jgi:hypothetical protein
VPFLRWGERRGWFGFLRCAIACLTRWCTW